jgi:hypothetical protein
MGRNPGLFDLISQDLHRHIAGGQDPEGAVAGDGQDQFWFAYPGHGTADDRIAHAEEIPALLPEPF